jgi:hypothetical protein
VAAGVQGLVGLGGEPEMRARAGVAHGDSQRAGALVPQEGDVGPAADAAR